MTATTASPAAQSEVRLPHLVVRTLGQHHVTVTLSRPEVHNALNMELVGSLTRVLQTLPKPVRTVLLEGAGSSFCAGADLRGWRGDAGEDAPAPVAADALATLLQAMRAVPQIVVAKVQGPAAAGGAGLVAACDIVVASDAARFHFPEARLGLVPAVISPYVQRAFGTARTRYLFLTAAVLTGSEALSAGLVHRLARQAELDAATQQVLQALWRAGPSALAECKWLLDAIDAAPPAERQKQCADTLERVRVGDEAQEGIRAFFAREKPHWSLS